MKILVVDDDESNRLLACLELRDLGHEIISAANGREALELFDREKPQMVTLDLELPDINGSELLREMRKRSSSVVIVMLTGRDRNNELEFPEANSYIVKTLHCDEALKACIRKHFGGT
ncbi:MAG: response regulator [Parcubacteria group bacterium]|jgi:DNA-binding response OmpR family regulator